MAAKKVDIMELRQLYLLKEKGESDYDLTTNTIISAGETINFGKGSVTTNTKQFLQTAELTKWFLDYRGLLAVYNHSEAQPNLFKLIAEILLKEFIPVGGTR
jgi:hypothetical protein